MYNKNLIERNAKFAPIAEHCAELYADIQSEVTKTSRPIPIDIDWRMIRKNSHDLLTHHVKDLNISHYLVIANLQSTGLDSLTPGLSFLSQFINVNWQDMRPVIRRTILREKSFLWFFDNLSRYLEKRVTSGSNNIDIEHLLVVLHQYGDDIATNLQNDFTLPNTVLTQIYKMKLEGLPLTSASLSVEKTTSAVELTQDTELKILKSNPNAVSLDFAKTAEEFDRDNQSPDTERGLRLESNTLSDETQLLNDSRSSLLRLAEIKLKATMDDPSAYHFRRIACWLSITEPPKSNIVGITQFKSPNRFELKELNEAQLSSSPKRIILAAESLLSRYPLWLDANILTINALKKLGVNYVSCIVVINQLLSNLLDRFGSLRQLKFSNGDKMFGDKCVSHSFHPEPDSMKLASLDVEFHDIGGHSQRITNVNQEQSLSGQLNRMKNELVSAKGLRVEHKSRIAQIQLCVADEKYELALAQIDFLWTQLQSIEFITWEPALSKSLIELNLSSLVAKYSANRLLGDEDKRRCRELFILLSGIDACAASKIDTTQFQ